MNLDRVTITGADDSVKPDQLLALSAEFPFVEWGILVSAAREGQPRFPTRAWIGELVGAWRGTLSDVLASLHVCGRWVRQILLGDRSVLQDMPAPLGFFERVQLNFHAERHEVNWSAAAELLASLDQQVIVQMDGTKNNERLLGMCRSAGLDAVPLFDTSGGAGVVPVEWPRPNMYIPYHGYAGGLGPDTLERELPRIAAAATFPWASVGPEARIWIDMERRVRSDDDTRLDLDKVRRVLERCAPIVRQTGAP